MDSTAPTPNSPATDLPIRERLLAWKEIVETANPPATRPLDTVGKWLVITRAAVFPMTIWSGLIGGLLAVEANRVAGGAPVDWGLFLLAVVGLILAHAANNMINDYFDTTGGVDTEGYVRALYAPHPILSGWVTKRQLGTAILIVNDRQNAAVGVQHQRGRFGEIRRAGTRPRLPSHQSLDLHRRLPFTPPPFSGASPLPRSGLSAASPRQGNLHALVETLVCVPPRTA